MTVSQRVRTLVYERDGGVCVHCGLPFMLTIQHRANRGMGGSKSRDHPANLITMCATSNTRLEADAEFADVGRRNGWKLSSWEDPTTQPVRYPDGLFYTLTNEGTKERVNG